LDFKSAEGNIFELESKKTKTRNLCSEFLYLGTFSSDFKNFTFKKIIFKAEIYRCIFGTFFALE